LKRFIIVMLIFLTGCSGATGEDIIKPDPLAPNAASKTDEAAVKAILAEEVTGEITISSYLNHNYIQIFSKARKAFEDKYPNAKVKIDVYESVPVIQEYENEYGVTQYRTLQTDEAQKEADYIRMINTELIGGGSADIILIDVIPHYRYIDGGYFEDLRAFIDLDAGFDKAALRMNLIEAMEYKGGIYTFPTGYWFEFFAYDASLFNYEEIALLSAQDAFTFGELITIAEKAFERNDKAHNMFGLTGGKYQSMHIFSKLLAENYTYFVNLENKKANFDDGRFEELLLSVREYCKKGYIKDESEINNAWNDGTFVRKVNHPNPNLDERFFYKFESNLNLMQNFDKEQDLTKKMGVRGMGPDIGIDDDDIVAGMAADHNGNVSFRSVYICAINANSKNKRAAWEFIKVLAGEEIQSEYEVYGVPINKNSLEEYAEATELALGGQMKSKLTDENREAYNAYLACLEKFADMVNTYTHRDGRIDQMIKDEVTLYFSGEKSAKNVARALQNKINLYLNE